MSSGEEIGREAPPAAEDLPHLAPRDPDAHKGDFGRVLIVGGSRGMSGAAALAGMSALRSGAGLVTVAVPEPCLETVAGWAPCLMTKSLPADGEGRLSLAAAASLAGPLATASVVACGPGMGRSTDLTEFMRRMYAAVPTPMVVDADGLNALAGAELPAPAGPRVLTPHPGELQRLTGVAAGPEQPDAARRLARQGRCVVLLKGRHTRITDGRREAVNPTGNPGMATAGAGDVLTGVIAGLLGQGCSTWDAARLGAYLHGRAGDLAAQQFGQVSMIASDLLQFLPAAFREWEPATPPPNADA
jgi:NAD(P)H-hydrate epimerase